MSVSTRIQQLSNRMSPFNDWFMQSEWLQRLGDPDISDFVVGNPQEKPMPNFTDALHTWSKPHHHLWYAYHENEPGPREVIARSLSQRNGVPYDPEDVFLTNGAFAAISVTLMTIVDPGDEVIFVSPPWFFYESLIEASGAVSVRVKCDPVTFDLDVEAIADAITPRTRAVIINSPNNPTGRIYPPETLQDLAVALKNRSRQIDRTIYLISDEAYNRIVFDEREFHSPAVVYPNTFIIYTYGKTLLTPGQRLGYIAMPPYMENREQLREGLYTAQLATGFAFPNALLQHALEDLEQLCIDVTHLQEKRDWLGKALQDMSYELQLPEGTFYLLVKSPLDDDRAFVNLLAGENIFCLPGSTFEMPGYFRISLTANDDMIERAIPGFQRVLASVREHA